MVSQARLRFPVLLLGLLSLVLGLWAGLLLVGWQLPVPFLSLPGAHGPLMVNGVLATLIGLERAVGLGRRAYYASPALTGSGSVLLAFGAPPSIAIPLVVAGAALLVVAFVVIHARQPALPSVVLTLGAAWLLVGDVLWWYGLDIPWLIPWWGSFLVMLIAGERLELNRVLPIPASRRRLLIAFFALESVSGFASLASFQIGTELLALSWVLIAAWLLLYDVARKNLARPGLPRFIGSTLMGGYVWLAVGAGLVLGYGGIQPDSLAYDAELHAVFLGFVLSMVFAHAPVILPAVLGRPLPFRRGLYGPVAVLDASLAARVGADLMGLGTLREWAALFNVVAIGAFGLVLVASLLLGTSRLRRLLAFDASAFFP